MLIWDVYNNFIITDFAIYSTGFSIKKTFLNKINVKRKTEINFRRLVSTFRNYVLNNTINNL